MRAVGKEIPAPQANGSRSVKNDSEGLLRVFGDTDQIRVGNSSDSASHTRTLSFVHDAK